MEIKWIAIAAIVLIGGAALLRTAKEWPETCRTTCAPRLVVRTAAYGLCECAPSTTPAPPDGGTHG